MITDEKTDNERVRGGMSAEALRRKLFELNE